MYFIFDLGLAAKGQARDCWPSKSEQQHWEGNSQNQGNKNSFLNGVCVHSHKQELQREKELRVIPKN